LPYLQGTIGAKVFEVGEAPSRIIDINDPWVVEIDWTLTGPAQRFVSGSWAVDVYMESIGPGPEFELPTEDLENIPLDPTGDGHYHARFDVPAGFIKTRLENWRKELLERGQQPDKLKTDTVYKMVCTVTYKDVGGRPGPIAGFVEMPMLQFYYPVDSYLENIDEEKGVTPQENVTDYIEFSNKAKV
jgi:hypothetical protein